MFKNLEQNNSASVNLLSATTSNRLFSSREITKSVVDANVKVMRASAFEKSDDCRSD